MAASMGYFFIPALAVFIYFLMASKTLQSAQTLFIEGSEPTKLFALIDDVKHFDRIDKTITNTSVVSMKQVEDSRVVEVSHVRHSRQLGHLKAVTSFHILPSDLTLTVISNARLFYVFPVHYNVTFSFLSASRRKVTGTQVTIKSFMELPLLLATVNEAGFTKEISELVTNARRLFV